MSLQLHQVLSDLLLLFRNLVSPRTLKKCVNI